MPDQDGLRFLFDINDKITAKLAKIEAKSKSSAAKIDKAFTRASRSQQTNAAKAIAAQQRLIATREKAHTRAIAGLKRESDAFKRSMTRMASAAAVAFAAVASKALSMASGYDAAMRSVQAKTGATGETMDRLTAQSREMGRTTVHSATEAARGQAFLAQAGFDANEILQALPATLALATAGELDLASAADIASNVLSGFRLETEHTGRVTDVLAAIAAKTNTSVSQMGVALAKAAPAAAAAGWSLEQTAAAIGRLSDAGIQGEEAGTVLKTMLARLAAPTGKLDTLMRNVGLSVKDTSGKMLPLNDIIAQLAPHADNTGLMFELLGTRGANAGLILGSLASDDLTNLTAELENSEGAAQEMADIMSGGLWGSIKSINSVVESAYISFGNRLAPILKTVATLFGKLPSPIQEVVVVVGSLATAMGGLMLIAPQSFGALVQFPGKLLKLASATSRATAVTKILTAKQWLLNAAMTANPIVLVVAAVGALALAVSTFLSREGGALERWFAKGAPEIRDLVNGVQDLKAEADRLRPSIDAVNMVADKWLETTGEQLPKAIRDLIIAGKPMDEVLGAIAAKSADGSREGGILGRILSEVSDEMNSAARKAKIAEEAFEKLAEEEAAAAAEAEAAAAAMEKLTTEQDAAAAAAEKHAEKIADLAQTLQGLPTKAAKEEFEDLREAWASMGTEAQAASMDAYADALIAAEQAGHGLDDAELALNATRRATLRLEAKLEQASKDRKAADEKRFAAKKKALEEEAKALQAATQSASGFDLALAGVAGQMGGATGQALNLVIAMREHNKVQQLAVESGKEGEEQFSRSQIGAAKLAFAFSSIGDAIGGMAGKVLGELSGIASAFATGGIVGGITAGIGSLIKGIKGLFGRGKRKREKAAREEKARLASVAKAAEEAADRMRAAADIVYGAAVSAYNRAKSAGVAAYDAVFLAALESGAGQEEAIAKAAAAQIDASEKILAAEGEKFARMAAFEAALEAIRSGNAAGAVEAARQAAQETREAWDIAMDAVAQADQAATDAMAENSREKVKQAELAVDGINAATAKLADRSVSVKIDYREKRSGRWRGGEGDEFGRHRQHGGPVSAGQRYMVGEAGPEMFVPSQSGRIEPNGSSGGGVDAKALAAAVAGALEGMKMDVDGRDFGRLVVRHQPLAVAELGGRR